MNPTTIPKRFEGVIFSFLLSLFMTLIVSGVSTLRTLGPSNAALPAWAANFVSSWPVAFVAVLIVAPLVRKLVAGLVQKDMDKIHK